MSYNSISIIKDGEKIIAFNKENNRRFKLNKMGAIIISLLKKGLTRDQIIQMINERFHGEFDAEINSFIQKLDNLNLIKSHISKQNAREEFKLVYLNVTSGCNMFCKYCCVDANGGKIIKNQEQLSFPLICEVIDRISEINNSIEINIMGGEPFYREDILDIINYIYQKNIPCSLTTNGTLITDNIAAKLPKDIFIKVSLDSINESDNNKLRSKTKEAVRGIYSLINHGLKPVIGVTLSRTALNSIDETLEFCRKNKLDISIAILEPFGRGTECESEILSSEEIKMVFKRLVAYYGSYEVAREYFNFCKHVNYRENYQSHSCGIARTIFSVAANGDVFPCVNLHLSQFKLGNMLIDDIDNLLNNLADFSEKITIDYISECKGCEYSNICGGGCRSKSFWKYGDLCGERVDCENYQWFIRNDLLEL